MRDEDRKICSYWKEVIEKYKKTPPKNQSEDDHYEHAIETVKRLKGE